MREFTYLHPKTLAEVMTLLDQYREQAKILAGGTDLMIELRKDAGPKNLEMLINIAHLTELNYIQEDGEWIRIGAGTPHVELVQSQLLNQVVSALPAAARTVGSPQIRTRGTIGGNIMNASPAADVVPVLVALDAVLTFRSIQGERKVAITEIFERPYQTNVRADELLVEVSFKKLSVFAKSSFVKLGRRNALAIARMNVAVIGEQDDQGVICDLRIAPGSTTPIPIRIKVAEDVLIGQKPTEELITAACGKVSEEMINLSGYRWSTDYKKPVIEALTRRGLRQILGVK